MAQNLNMATSHTFTNTYRRTASIVFDYFIMAVALAVYYSRLASVIFIVWLALSFCVLFSYIRFLPFFRHNVNCIFKILILISEFSDGRSQRVSVEKVRVDVWFVTNNLFFTCLSGLLSVLYLSGAYWIMVIYYRYKEFRRL